MQYIHQAEGNIPPVAVNSPDRQELLQLHALLRNKQDLDDSMSCEDSDCNSSASETIITTSAGSVAQIRGLYSPDINIHDGEMAQRLIEQGDTRPLKDTVSVQQTISHQHDLNGQNNSAAIVHSKHDDCVNKTDSPTLMDQESKKRKIASDSDQSLIEEEKDKHNNPLYPLFRNKDQREMGAKSDKPTSDKKTTEVRSEKADKKADKQTSKKKKKSTARKDKEGDSYINTDIEDLLKLSEESMQTLDVRTVIEFSSRIKHCAAEMKKQFADESKACVKELKENFQKTTANLKADFKQEMESDIQKVMEIYEKDVKTLKEEVHQQKVKTQLLGDLLQQSHHIQHDLCKRLDTVELNSARKSAILTGLDFSKQKKERIQQILAFFRDTLEVDARIEDSYFLGDADPRPVVIIFETYADKQYIWQFKHHLKNYTGRDKKGIFLNDYLPQIVNEKKKRERDIILDYKDHDVKTKIEHTKDGLKIGASMYKKQVTVPEPSEMLDLSPKELDDTLAIPTCRGEKIIIEDSVYVGYCLDVKNHQQVRQAYLKLKILNARARHIVCAYRLPGAELHHMSDYVDDDEHGAGRALLKAMQENDITNKVFYVARFCGSNKLGSQRINGYLRAAENVLNLYPANKILRTDQSFHNEDYRDKLFKERAERKKRQKEKAGASQKDSKTKTCEYTPRQFAEKPRRYKVKDKTERHNPINPWAKEDLD